MKSKIDWPCSRSEMWEDLYCTEENWNKENPPSLLDITMKQIGVIIHALVGR